MARTLIRQSEQIRNSDSYNDSLDRSTALTAEDIEADLNYLRSQLKYLLGQGNWNGDIPDNFDLTGIHDKKLMYWVDKDDDVTVPAGQNWDILSGSEKPDDVISIASTMEGAAVAQLAGSVGSHSITMNSDESNLISIRDATTKEPLMSGADQVYGLLQVGSVATDGNAFANTGNDRGQISFVTINIATRTPSAVSVAEMEGSVIEYYYRKRSEFFNLPVQAFISEPQNTTSTTPEYDRNAAYDSGNRNLMYTGTAATGSATSSAAWKISRYNMASGAIQYADGNENFDNIWDNRESLSYS